MKTNILFFGTPEFSVPSLQALHEAGCTICGVVTQPDKPVGRKQTFTPSPVKILAQKLGIPVFEPTSLKTSEAQTQISALKPDLVVVVAYGKILPQWLLDLPKYGCLNVHPSLLPKYRGASPIPAPILHGDVETGVTIMLMDAELDHGPILRTTTYKLRADITGNELSKELSSLGAELLASTVADWLAEKIKPQEQDHSKATFTKILSRDDGKLDWNKSALEIERMIRAYDPWPGTWYELKNQKRLKILKASLLHASIGCASNPTPGYFWQTEQKELAVNCNPGSLILDSVQRESGKPMSGKEFAKGNIFPLP